MSSAEVLIGGHRAIRRIGLGAMRLTGDDLWGPYPDRDAGVQFLRQAVAEGITLIDTADLYGPHVNEELIRDALCPYADGVTVATKGGLVRGRPDFESFTPIGHPNYLRQAARLSARRLGVACIDLYYLHSGWATDVPFADQVGTLFELQQEGVIRHIGLSNVSVEQFELARSMGDIAAVTANYNVANRRHKDLLSATHDSDTIFVPWQPVSLIPGVDARTDVRGVGEIRNVLEPIALRYGTSVAQLSLAWLLHHEPNIVAIPGSTDIAHVRQNLAALELELDDADVRVIDAVGVQADAEGTIANVDEHAHSRV